MHAHTALLAAVLSPLAFVSPALAQDQGASQQAQPVLDRDAIVAKHIRPLIDAYEIPGAMVGLYRDGELSFHAVGTLGFDTDQAPGQTTMYEFGSIGKVLTGVFFADAIRRGEVSKNTRVSELMPEGMEVVKSASGKEIELWHLTTHSSGWGPMPLNLMPKDPDRPFSGYTRAMLYPALGVTPLTFEPGESFAYSNLGVGVLGTLIADHAGGEYEQLVQQRVLEPLGVTDCAITLSDEQEARLAPATRGGLGVKPWHDANPFAPAGLWVTTAPELMRFALANLKEGDEHVGGIYKSLEMARQPLHFAESMGQQVCFGWFIARDGKSYWHNGMTGGYSSYMGLNRDMDAAVVVLTNGATFKTTLAGEKIFQELAGMSPEPVNVTRPKPIAEDLAARLRGTYRSIYAFDIEIVIERGMLYARLTNQTFNRLHPVDEVNAGEARFAYDGIDAALGFELPDEGAKASSVTLYQNGQEMKCGRVEK